ncbi:MULTISPECIES: lipid-A-disaccharide synthase [unclassified Gilliamella]|uniref:lipid-A-disaccharide synthase n=1 Tax=unclassified Gilliamella TaxID=2685620 RepID=UPI002269C424|nr:MULTISPECIES: lipid-A-disaccharide synthase [unclassified Gilliamella]MCX8601666.1 lipid-A-disaccharide synthase [Gilliamella sp. B3722]MCX8608588.1 lipid-A-disaccharide synthase [Gilliamella sp. B3771]MCX8610929.1 lipid-A-disaccharide synthase [Gilliamella sp. B3891]MCX8613397.1 lipid-A-disaccharide synthase [Gilliamella sp. B3773]MCX8615240.1 lipid-A-disaccharide synthase [Gilliamella sp. B3770]
MTNKPLTIALVAGETSGDILGAGLIRSLKQHHPNIHFVGIAGPLMQAQGCQAWYEMDELSVMGIVEVLGRLRRILAIRKDITKRLIALKPDIFIGIDAPDFNLSLEGKLKQAGIKTIHYVSPSVWAWKQKRVFKIKRNTNLILAFLPFEKAFYDKFDVPCRFIGHKMADDIPLEPDQIAMRQQLGIAPTGRCLALLPGSRHTEVTLLSAPFLQAAQLLRERYPDLHIVVPLVNAKRRQEFEQIKAQIAPQLEVQLLDGHAREAMIASNAAILASGTVALECMLAKCPMVVGYKMKPFTFWLAKKLIKTPYVSLPNILAGKQIVPELLQHDCTPENIANHIIPYLESDNADLKNTFLSLHKQIRCNADEQAAQAVLDVLEDSPCC